MARDNKLFAGPTARSKEIFKFYKKTYGNQFRISSTIYCAILKEFLEARIKTILLDNCPLEFPGRLGSLSIRQRKVSVKLKDGKLDTTKLMINHKETNQLWKDKPELRHKKYVYHVPTHYFRFIWTKYRAVIQNISAYSFIPSRTNNRLIAKYANDPNYKLEFYGYTHSTNQR